MEWADYCAPPLIHALLQKFTLTTCNGLERCHGPRSHLSSDGDEAAGVGTVGCSDQSDCFALLCARTETDSRLLVTAEGRRGSCR
jgi:hypothetical protein